MVGSMLLLSVGEPTARQRLVDGVRHHLGGVPHGVVDDDGAILGLARGPLFIALDDLRNVRTPDDAVSRGDQLHIESVQRFEGGLRLVAVREEDVRVVFLRLLADDAEIVLVVIAFAGGEMLAEGVV